MPDLQRFRQSGVEPTTGITTGLPGSVVATPRQVRPSVKALQILDTIDRTAPIVQQQLEQMSFEQGREDTLQALGGLSLSTTEGQRKFAEMVRDDKIPLGANPVVDKVLRRHGYAMLAGAAIDYVKTEYNASPYVGASREVVAEQAQGWIRDFMEDRGINPADPSSIAFFNPNVEARLMRDFLPFATSVAIKKNETDLIRDAADMASNGARETLDKLWTAQFTADREAYLDQVSADIQQNIQEAIATGANPEQIQQQAWRGVEASVRDFMMNSLRVDPSDPDAVVDIQESYRAAIDVLDGIPARVSIDGQPLENNAWLREQRSQVLNRVDNIRSEAINMVSRERGRAKVKTITKSRNSFFDAIRQAAQTGEDPVRAVDLMEASILATQDGLDDATRGRIADYAKEARRLADPAAALFRSPLPESEFQERLAVMDRMPTEQQLEFLQSLGREQHTVAMERMGKLGDKISDRASEYMGQIRNLYRVFMQPSNPDDVLSGASSNLAFQQYVNERMRVLEYYMTGGTEVFRNIQTGELNKSYAELDEALRAVADRVRNDIEKEAMRLFPGTFEGSPAPANVATQRARANPVQNPVEQQDLQRALQEQLQAAIEQARGEATASEETGPAALRALLSGDDTEE